MLTTPRNYRVRNLLLFVGVAVLGCGGDQPINTSMYDMAMPDLKQPDNTETLISTLKERAKADLDCMYLGYMVVKKCSSAKVFFVDCGDGSPPKTGYYYLDGSSWLSGEQVQASINRYKDYLLNAQDIQQKINTPGMCM